MFECGIHLVSNRDQHIVFVHIILRNGYIVPNILISGCAVCQLEEAQG
jgi:hypothetical protein